MTQFFYLLRWNYLRQKDLFLLFTLAQVLLSISLLFGYPLVIGEIDTTAAYYLSSGSVLIGIISIGCTISSPVIANAKSEGHVDYVRALPIPLYFFSQYCHADVSVDSHDWFDVFTNHVPCKSSSRLDKPSLSCSSICPFCQPPTSLCL